MGGRRRDGAGLNEGTSLPDVSDMQRHVLGYVRYKAISIIAVSLYLILWSIALALFGFLWWPFALFAFVPLLVVHRLSDGGRMLDPETWFKGWRGESSVKKRLRELEPLGYRIVNHLDIGHGDVDHAVVGPTGVSPSRPRTTRGSSPGAGPRSPRTTTRPTTSSIRPCVRRSRYATGSTFDGWKRSLSSREVPSTAHGSSSRE